MLPGFFFHFTHILFFGCALFFKSPVFLWFSTQNVENHVEIVHNFYPPPFSSQIMSIISPFFPKKRGRPQWLLYPEIFDFPLDSLLFR